MGIIITLRRRLLCSLRWLLLLLRHLLLLLLLLISRHVVLISHHRIWRVRRDRHGLTATLLHLPRRRRPREIGSRARHEPVEGIVDVSQILGSVGVVSVSVLLWSRWG
jgi:hypothetical protein